MLKKWFFVVFLVPIIHAKLHACRNVFIMNDVDEFEKNLRGCNIIIGFLKIVLIENVVTADYANISFPELTDIRGYLLLYRVYGLTTLEYLFPNLRVIRGNSLMLDYSFILYDMLHFAFRLVCIIWGTSQEVPLGLTNAPDYVMSIQLIGLKSGIPIIACIILTPMKENVILVLSNATVGCDISMPGECIGCRDRKPDQCFECKLYKDKNRCTSKCPKYKYLYATLGLCLTERECYNLSNETWWIFNGECMKSCPTHYIRVSKAEGWCKPCGDFCKKICFGMQIESIEQAEKLFECTHIKGSLSIRISSKATAFELEKNLGMIETIEGFLKIYRSFPLTSLEFSLIVYENQNLHKLWDWEHFHLNITKGTFMFHFNPQLCPIEINKLAHLTKLNYTDYDVSPYSNGDKRACNNITLNVTIKELTSSNVTLTWDNATSFTNESLIGYLVYYIEDPFMNMSIYDEKDTCDLNTWNTIFVSNNSVVLNRLNAYAQYAYYIKIYSRSPSVSGQTKIAYFTTSTTDPSEVYDLNSWSNNSNTVTVTWKPPEFHNGVLSHYVFYVYYQQDDPSFIYQRNYCKSPHQYVVQDTTPLVVNDSLNETQPDCCQNKKRPWNTFVSICDQPNAPIESTNKCKNYMYTTIDATEENSTKINKRSLDPQSILEFKITDPNATSYTITALPHFNLFIILITACNTDLNCSPSQMISQRTLRKEDADDILEVIIKVDHLSIVVKWEEPRHPNGVIVAYYIKHKRTDLVHSKSLIECVTREDFVSKSHEYVMKNFLPGKYSIRVQAVSLSGPGRFTDWKEFEILSPSHATLTAFIIIFMLLTVCVVGGLYCYCRCKKIRNLDQMSLLRRDDYNGAYIEDDWELPRADVEILKELGQGSFGLVYDGYIKSQNCHCAVKTVNSNASTNEKMHFLHEAAVMKAFSRAHHVVKLLGVVSKGQPPLVVMELMARGDLKTYLREARSSATMSCVEMYRMAAEIADGMMYLSARKFIHRDLAARNCMVSADKTVKVGDFGMTRDVYEMDYYRKESGGMMPIRWMAPESLADGVFTTDSDVWSYGVVLWEIASAAEQPYQGLANEQVLQFVTARGTLLRPSECPDLLYEIMDACWMWQPSQRPLFKDIVEKLEGHVGQHFKLVSFYHSAEGDDFRINARQRVYNPPALTSYTRNAPVYWDTSYDDISL